MYASAHEVTRNTADLVRPPRRVRPSDATRALRTEKGPWDPGLVPMLVEPLDMLASREYQGIVFVGPARSGKTMAMMLGGLAYAVTCAPGDMLITQMSQDTARDFSLTDVDRALRHSPELAAALSPRARDDNTYDKFFRSGMRLKLGWPSVSQLSSKTLRFAFCTDYDRPENRDNVDGEGPLWSLLFKRVQTYMSAGKCVAESSPEAEYLDARWRPSTPHEAPPARGLLEVYNLGTRARWYWPCWHCGEFFQAQPGLACFGLPPEKELEERIRTEDLLNLARRYALVVCSHCGGTHEQRQRPEMSARGVWLHEGERVAKDGSKDGARRGTNIASYWLGGVAAVYQSWESILLNEFQARSTYLRTGEESSLKFTRNTDQAAAYLPKAVANRRSADELQKRLEDFPKAVVPSGTRFLTAAVDVQAGRFAVEVFGWGVGLESWLVDRFDITSSKRMEDGRNAGLEPAAYLEDWDILTERVIEARYPIAGTEVTMGIHLTCCDSGGKAGVSGKAYGYYRWLKKRRKNFRFRLVKGANSLNAPTASISWPDSTDRRDRKEGGRGDVPVWMLNTNVLKDLVVGDLARVEQGPGFVHLPNWLPVEFFNELTAETRTDKGWKNTGRERNEAFDLHVYNRAAVKICKADRINWARPPVWAQERKVPETGAVPAEPVAVMSPPPKKVARPARRGNWVKGWR
jgi:phage terminase large subunit GpA-like protein